MIRVNYMGTKYFLTSKMKKPKHKNKYNHNISYYATAVYYINNVNDDFNFFADFETHKCTIFFDELGRVLYIHELKGVC